jgi:hypothetical protein
LRCSRAEELSSTPEQLQALTAQFDLGGEHTAAAGHAFKKVAARRRAAPATGVKRLAVATAREADNSFAEF